MKLKKSNIDSGDTWKMKGAIIALLILFVFFVPIPKIASLIFIWIILILLCNILSGCWYFSAFIATTFIAILFILERNQIQLFFEIMSSHKLSNSGSGECSPAAFGL